MEELKAKLDGTLEKMERLEKLIDVLGQSRNDLKDDFTDYVCSGVDNPAPYCGNMTEECCDVRGWCITAKCKGFYPKAYLPEGRNEGEDTNSNINGEYPDNLRDGPGDNGN